MIRRSLSGKKIHLILILTVSFVLSPLIYSSSVNLKIPQIISSDIPKTVSVGIPFRISLIILSDNKIDFLKVQFEGVSKNIKPVNVRGNLFTIDMIAQRPGIKNIKIFAIDIKHNVGKPVGKSLIAYKKDSDKKNTDISGTRTPEMVEQTKPPVSEISIEPPVFRLDKYEFCTGDAVEIRGKNFVERLTLRFGNRKIKIDRFKDNFIRFRFINISGKNYLYVKNSSGETKSKKQIVVRGAPLIYSFSPPETGEKEILKIKGKDIKCVNRVLMKVKGLGFNKTYHPELYGKSGEDLLRIKMPDIFNYPGKAMLQLFSPCGSSNKVEVTIKEDGVTYLTPEILDVDKREAAPGSTVIVRVKELSDPHKDKVNVSFNKLKGIVEKIKFSSKKRYSLEVTIPDDLENRVDYNQRVRVSSFGEVFESKEDFFLFGPPEVLKIKRADWNRKYIEISGHNFVEKGTYVYFSGVNGEWIPAKDLFYMGFDKVQVKLPMNVMKGPVKVKTVVGKISQERISSILFSPDDEKDS